jgi:hypothetical protein
MDKESQKTYVVKIDTSEAIAAINELYSHVEKMFKKIPSLIKIKLEKEESNG